MAGKILVSLFGGLIGLCGVLVVFYLAEALKAAWKQVWRKFNEKKIAIIQIWV